MTEPQSRRRRRIIPVHLYAIWAIWEILPGLFGGPLASLGEWPRDTVGQRGRFSQTPPLTGGWRITKLISVRYLCSILVLAWLALNGAGCDTPSEPEIPIWETAKLSDLAPRTPGQPQAEFRVVARFDIHVFDVPADNVDKLEDLWRLLSARPIRTNSYNAFAQNFFRVRFGRAEIWDSLLGVLKDAGARRGGTTALGLASDGPTDLPIAELPRPGVISYATMNLSWERASVGIGRLVLRLRAEPIPGARGVRKIVAYPVSTPAISSAIPALDAKVREREVYFASAAFAAQMGPGDLLILGPNEYSAERMTLGGLFFNEPQDVLFIDPETSDPPRRKPAVRVFVLVCVGMID